jgi:type I restriction enzyme M protein
MFPQTKIGVCVWLLQHPTGRAAPVKFVDARQLGREPDSGALSTHVLEAADIETIAATVAASENRAGFSVIAAPDEIRAHGYSLHPPEYQDRATARTSARAAREELDALFAGLDPPSYKLGDNEGWPRRPLGDLCDICSGVPHSSLKQAVSRVQRSPNPVPVVHPRHLRDGLIEAGDAPCADSSSLEEYRLLAGDVLIVRTGAMGQTAIVQGHESGWLPHTNLLRLRVTDLAALDPAYLLAYLSQAAVQARIRDRSVRSVTTSLSVANLKDIEMPLPPLVHQRRILAALKALDEQTVTIERLLTTARTARTAFSRHLTDGTVVLTERDAL